MIEGIGFPEKLRTIARHQSLEKSAKLVDACCRNVTKFDLAGSCFGDFEGYYVLLLSLSA